MKVRQMKFYNGIAMSPGSSGTQDPANSVRRDELSPVIYYYIY